MLRSIRTNTVVGGLAAAVLGLGLAVGTADHTPASAAPQPDTAATTPATQATTAETTKPESAKAATPAKQANEVRVKYQAQPNYYWCGPAAARNALSAAGHDITMANLARTMGTTESGTNSANDITAALNKVTGSTKYRTTELANPTITTTQADTLKHDIVTTIDERRAVVANVAGTATDTDGATHSYEGGHYIAVHGYRDNGRQVEIADSADPNTAHYWIDTTDLANWSATRGYSH